MDNNKQPEMTAMCMEVAGIESIHSVNAGPNVVGGVQPEEMKGYRLGYSFGSSCEASCMETD